MSRDISSLPMTRRQLALGAAGVAALSVLPRGAMIAAAQETTDLSTLGYPELNITVTDAEGVVRRLLASDAKLTRLEVRQAGLNEAFTELTREAA